MPTACLADTGVTKEGWGEKRESLFTVKQVMLYREREELCVAVWEARGRGKGGGCSEPLLTLRWESCVTAPEKKRRNINSQCACLSCWMSNRDHKNAQDWAVVR